LVSNFFAVIPFQFFGIFVFSRPETQLTDNGRAEGGMAVFTVVEKKQGNPARAFPD
jgi:hypothetical protein